MSTPGKITTDPDYHEFVAIKQSEGITSSICESFETSEISFRTFSDHSLSLSYDDNTVCSNVSAEYLKDADSLEASVPNLRLGDKVNEAESKLSEDKSLAANVDELVSEKDVLIFEEQGKKTESSMDQNNISQTGSISDFNSSTHQKQSDVVFEPTSESLVSRVCTNISTDTSKEIDNLDNSVSNELSFCDKVDLEETKLSEHQSPKANLDKPVLEKDVLIFVELDTNTESPLDQNNHSQTDIFSDTTSTHENQSDIIFEQSNESLHLSQVCTNNSTECFKEINSLDESVPNELNLGNKVNLDESKVTDDKSPKTDLNEPVTEEQSNKTESPGDQNNHSQTIEAINIVNINIDGMSTSELISSRNEKESSVVLEKMDESILLHKSTDISMDCSKEITSLDKSVNELSHVDKVNLEEVIDHKSPSEMESPIDQINHSQTIKNININGLSVSGLTHEEESGVYLEKMYEALKSQVSSNISIDSSKEIDILNKSVPNQMSLGDNGNLDEAKLSEHKLPRADLDKPVTEKQSNENELPVGQSNHSQTIDDTSVVNINIDGMSISEFIASTHEKESGVLEQMDEPLLSHFRTNVSADFSKELDNVDQSVPDEFSLGDKVNQEESTVTDIKTPRADLDEPVTEEQCNEMESLTDQNNHSQTVSIAESISSILEKESGIVLEQLDESPLSTKSTNISTDCCSKEIISLDQSVPNELSLGDNVDLKESEVTDHKSPRGDTDEPVTGKQGCEMESPKDQNNSSQTVENINLDGMSISESVHNKDSDVVLDQMDESPLSRMRTNDSADCSKEIDNVDQSIPNELSLGDKVNEEESEVTVHKSPRTYAAEPVSEKDGLIFEAERKKTPPTTGQTNHSERDSISNLTSSTHRKQLDFVLDQTDKSVLSLASTNIFIECSKEIDNFDNSVPNELSLVGKVNLEECKHTGHKSSRANSEKLVSEKDGLILEEQSKKTQSPTDQTNHSERDSISDFTTSTHHKQSDDLLEQVDKSLLTLMCTNISTDCSKKIVSLDKSVPNEVSVDDKANMGESKLTEHKLGGADVDNLLSKKDGFLFEEQGKKAMSPTNDFITLRHQKQSSVVSKDADESLLSLVCTNISAVCSKEMDSFDASNAKRAVDVVPFGFDERFTEEAANLSQHILEMSPETTLDSDGDNNITVITAKQLGADKSASPKTSRSLFGNSSVKSCSPTKLKAQGLAVGSQSFTPSPIEFSMQVFFNCMHNVFESLTFVFCSFNLSAHCSNILKFWFLKYQISLWKENLVSHIFN